MERAIEFLIKWFLLIVFAGWIMYWMVLPTKVSRKEWSPELTAFTNTTYFGRLGKNIFVYGVPVFVMAVFGCIYLHLQQKRTSKEVVQKVKRGSKVGAFFKRPAVVNGPMGILTATELLFFIMFVALVIWLTVVFIYVGFERVPAVVETTGYNVWEVKLENAALRIGLVGNFCLVFLFFPVTRASSLLPLIGLTSESSVRYHIWMGHITMFVFTVHGLLYFLYWASINRFDEVIKWASQGASNVAGEISLLAGLLMWVTSYNPIRRKFYEVFFYTHQLYTLFLIFFALHVGTGHFFWNLPGVYLFVLDRYLRFLQSSSNIQVISARVLPSAYEITFAKSRGCNYSALSSLFLNIPTVSRLQWHAFTIISSSRLEPDSMSVVIKKEGKWTTKLYDVLAAEDPSPSVLRAAVEGPYGPNTNHFLNYDSLLLVSGGSGITPFFGMIRELLHIAATVPKEHRHIPDVHLICAFKNSADFKMLDLMLPVTGTYNNELSQLNLRIDAYITREKEYVPVKKQSQTLWFKYSPNDHKINHALGTNQWLWLGAVITASFLAFLLLLGIATRYYIYENMQGGSGHHVRYSIAASTRHSLVLFLLCVSIVLVASFAVLYIKKKAAASEVGHVESSSSPGTSPDGSSAKKFDMEVESLPNEFVHNATNMQYGKRPDLRKILLEHTSKKKIGTFVSGPSQMRREVASVCGSGLANNLHFESCSFTW